MSIQGGGVVGGPEMVSSGFKIDSFNLVFFLMQSPIYPREVFTCMPFIYNLHVTAYTFHLLESVLKFSKECVEMVKITNTDQSHRFYEYDKTESRTKTDPWKHQR